MEGLFEENKVLKRNITRIKQVINDKLGLIKAEERKEIEKEKTGIAGKNSELDSNSIKDNDGNSVASFSALGGCGAQKIDIKKVEMINQQVQ